MSDSFPNSIRGCAEKAQPIFEKNGWTWVGTKGEVPNVTEIARTIERLVQVTKEENKEAATGRLYAQVDEQGVVQVGITFTLGWIYPEDL